MLFFFTLIIDLYYFLFPAVIAQIFNPIEELVIPMGILTKESKAELKRHSLTVQINRKEAFNIIKNSITAFMLLTH